MNIEQLQIKYAHAIANLKQQLIKLYRIQLKKKN